jgi:hypothetical protein
MRSCSVSTAYGLEEGAALDAAAARRLAAHLLGAADLLGS